MKFGFCTPKLDNLLSVHSLLTGINRKQGDSHLAVRERSGYVMCSVARVRVGCRKLPACVFMEALRWEDQMKKMQASKTWVAINRVGTNLRASKSYLFIRFRWKAAWWLLWIPSLFRFLPFFFWFFLLLSVLCLARLFIAKEVRFFFNISIN